MKRLNLNHGDRYGKLTIISELEPIMVSNDKRRLILCKCDCGNNKKVLLNALRTKRVISCGCIKKQVSVKINERYGHLVITKFVDRISKEYPRIQLKCDCGNIIEMDVKNLKNKKDKSCGCKSLEKLKYKNKYTRKPFNIGDKRNMLTYLRDVEPKISYQTKNGKQYVLKQKMIETLCECGNKTIRYYQNIKKGLIKSCGCQRGAFQIGKPSHKKLYFTQEQEKRMIELFEQKINLRKIGKEFGVSDQVIKRIIKSHGYTIKQRRYDIVNDYFKNIDTEEKAYWLGFLAADGCIRKRIIKETGKYRGNGIYLKLSVLDENHMIKLRDSISPTAKISYYTNKGVTKKGTPYLSHTCDLRIHGNEIVEDIIKLGVGPQKTFTITKPNIEEKYYKHYIRGFFDGDGCCYIKKYEGKKYKTTLRAHYSIACASQKLKTFFKEELEKYEIPTKCRGELNLEIIGGFLSYKKFFEYLYKDATIYLKRKYDKGMEIINYITILPEYVTDTNKKPIRNWTNQEIDILINNNDKIPLSYLSKTLLPDKSKQQIHRMKKKLGLKSRRKINGYLKIRKELKGY